MFPPSQQLVCVSSTFFLKSYSGIKKNIHLIIITDFAFDENITRWINNATVRRRCQNIWLSDWSVETKKAVLRAELKTLVIFSIILRTSGSFYEF